MTPRAAPLSAQERRSALIAATLPLLRKHGRATTIRQIAAAAGVAEGTIFGVFDSKEALVGAALEAAFDPAVVVGGLRSLDPAQPLHTLLTEIVTVLQQRFRGVFELMSRMGMSGPPVARKHLADSRAEADKALIELLAPHANELRVPVSHLAHVTRLLTFSGSHPHLSDGRPLTPDEIASALLDGLLAKES